MKLFLNLLFYIFGIAIPILVVLVAIFKKSKNKIHNVINKLLL